VLFPTESNDRLLANLRDRKPSLGCFVFSHPNLAEVAGVAGMDVVIADMMFTSLDWTDIANMARAVRGTGASLMVRVQAFPWSGGTDPSSISSAARALSLGATAVTVSVSSKEEVRALAGLREDWHRLIHLRRFWKAEEFPAYAEKTRAGTLIVPTIESEGALRDLNEILAIDGIRLVWLAAGDLTKILGVPFKYEHPKVLKLLEDAVATAERHGAAIMYNMGLDQPDFDAMAAMARRMFDLGVRVVGLGAVEWHTQMALQQMRRGAIGN
jgi:2-keto-3-deoxy-L-rhamnonate aldolase RhmA